MKKHLIFLFLLNIPIICFCQKKEFSVFGIKLTDTAPIAYEKIQNNTKCELNKNYLDVYVNESNYEYSGKYFEFLDPDQTYAGKDVSWISIFESNYYKPNLYAILIHFGYILDLSEIEDIGVCLCDVYEFEKDPESSDECLILNSSSITIRIKNHEIIFINKEYDYKDKKFEEDIEEINKQIRLNAIKSDL